ncbi:hypothetical protein HN51_041527 [Arachis hypogaea]
MLSLCILFILLLLLMPLTSIANNKIHISSKLRLPEKLSITHHLPQELVSSILSRLPAKELWRCKFVCKSWFHLINDPNFVTNYYVVYNNSKLATITILISSLFKDLHFLAIKHSFLFFLVIMPQDPFLLKL